MLAVRLKIQTDDVRCTKDTSDWLLAPVMANQRRYTLHSCQMAGNGTSDDTGWLSQLAFIHSTTEY